jgi:hypothetical protein
MAYNKVFFHGAGPGIGDLIRDIDDASIPFVIKSIKNEGFVLEALQYRNAAHQIIYRDPGPGGAGDDHPDLSLSPAEAAGEHWARLELVLPAGIKDNRERVWIEPVNEIDTNAHAQWLGEFSNEYALLALANGYRMLLSGHNAGQPEPEHWELYFRQFLELCSEYPDRLGVSLHEAKLGDMTIPAWDKTWVPYLIGRYKFLHEACDRMKVRRPTIFISEWAWAYNDMPSDAIVRADIDWLSEEIAKHPNIRGICLWNLDAGGGAASQKLANQIGYVRELTLNTLWPDPPPIIEPGFRVEDEVESLPKHLTKVYGGRKLSDISMIAIHHTVTPNTYDWVRRIAAYHVNEKEWPGIGYHYCVTGDGRIIQTNYEETISYHVGSENDTTLGIALLGDFGDGQPTDIQIEAVNWLLGNISQDLPDAKVLPHRQIPHSRTSCPGNTWEEWFHQIAPIEPKPMSLEEFLWEDSLSTQCISLNPNAALQSAIFNDDFVPVGTEHWVIYDGKTYAYMAAETLGESLPRRLYYVLTPNWSDVSFIIDPDGEIPPDPPPTSPRIDMAKYFWPRGDYGPIVTLENNWGAGNERQQLQVGEDGDSYVTKNQQWERRRLVDTVEQGQTIDLIMDTSPGENRYYTFDGHWMPRMWGIGRSYISTGTTRFFNKGDCSPVTAYATESMLRFAEHYVRYELSGLEFNNVAVIEWIVGGEVDETYWFADGVGLIRWLKYNGLESKAVELIPVGDQENNVRENVPCARV